jgi:hypothetical protein
LQLVRAGTAAEPARVERDQELRALKARTEDQAGEIARLKAALAAFEQPDRANGGLRNSRLALKARAGSAEAQAERQAATISRLRAELAASNERLAQQAAHFMEEMRRIGAGTLPPSAQARRPGRDGQTRRLAERAAQVPARKSEPVAISAPQPAGPEKTDGVEKAASNGAEHGNKAMPSPAPASPAAAEMPQTAAIPRGRRKMRLLERITGMGKG